MRERRVHRLEFRAVAHGGRISSEARGRLSGRRCPRECAATKEPAEKRSKARPMACSSSRPGITPARAPARSDGADQLVMNVADGLAGAPEVIPAEPVARATRRKFRTSQTSVGPALPVLRSCPGQLGHREERSHGIGEPTRTPTDIPGRLTIARRAAATVRCSSYSGSSFDQALDEYVFVYVAAEGDLHVPATPNLSMPFTISGSLTSNWCTSDPLGKSQPV